MNRIKLFFTFMLIALLCAGAVSASSDVDNVTTVELNNFEHVAINQVADEHVAIADEDQIKTTLL